uniref:Uncharacterized protein n=1 Tax=Mycena chlorophos TaxID=658473 RepID=A0ABQ0LM20_MYCCL|nr:predicted protein [Mycena chlorophos]
MLPPPSLPLVELNPYVLVGNRDASLPGDLRTRAAVDASPKVIQKYVDGFYSLFPRAEIVYVKSSTNFFLTRRGYCVGKDVVTRRADRTRTRRGKEDVSGDFGAIILGRHGRYHLEHWHADKFSADVNLLELSGLEMVGRMGD